MHSEEIKLTVYCVLCCQKRLYSIPLGTAISLAHGGKTKSEMEIEEEPNIVSGPEEGAKTEEEGKGNNPPPSLFPFSKHTTGCIKAAFAVAKNAAFSLSLSRSWHQLQNTAPVSQWKHKGARGRFLQRRQFPPLLSQKPLKKLQKGSEQILAEASRKVKAVYDAVIILPFSFFSSLLRVSSGGVLLRGGGP